MFGTSALNCTPYGTTLLDFMDQNGLVDVDISLNKSPHAFKSDVYLVL